MKKLNNKIDMFCYRHPRFGIPNLMLYVVVISLAVWLLSIMDSSRMLMSPDPRKMGRCFSRMRNTCLWNRANTTVSTSSVPKFRTNTRLPSVMPASVSSRLENPIKPQHTALRIT